MLSALFLLSTPSTFYFVFCDLEGGLGRVRWAYSIILFDGGTWDYYDNASG
jgi:hypothetical protein